MFRPTKIERKKIKKIRHWKILIFLFLPGALSISAALAAQLEVKYDEGNPSIDTLEGVVKPIKVTTSSVLEKKPEFAAANATDAGPETSYHDNLQQTAWCEGAVGLGIGEWIKLEFGGQKKIAGVYFTPFFAKDKETLLANGRVKKMRIEAEGGFDHTVEFVNPGPDVFNPDWQIAYPGPYVDFTTDKAIKKPIKTSWLKFTIFEAYPGDKTQDTCISDITVASKHRDR